MINHRRISTELIEHAIDQLIRARATRSKVAIKPSFISEVLKELLDRRREEKQLLAEVNEILNSRGELINDLDGTLKVEEDPGFEIPDEPINKIIVNEVMSLNDLGESSWDSSKDIDEISGIEELDEDTEIRHYGSTNKRGPKPALIGRRRSFGPASITRHNSRHSESKARRLIIAALIAIIVMTFGPLLLLL